MRLSVSATQELPEGSQNPTYIIEALTSGTINIRTVTGMIFIDPNDVEQVLLAVKSVRETVSEVKSQWEK